MGLPGALEPRDRHPQQCGARHSGDAEWHAQSLTAVITPNAVGVKIINTASAITVKIRIGSRGTPARLAGHGMAISWKAQ